MPRNPNDIPGDASPPTRIRLIGHAICELSLRAPFLWPVVRPGVARYFGSLAAGWDQRTGAGSPGHLTALAAAVMSIPAAPERILEVGCGTGEASLFLAREFRGARVRGIDLSAEMVRQAQAKVGLDPEARIAFRRADASALPFEDRSFDLVVQVNMPLFAREARRVLRPGGHFVLASSQGAATPFHTAPERVSCRMRGHGLVQVATGSAGGGTYYVGHLPPS